MQELDLAIDRCDAILFAQRCCSAIEVARRAARDAKRFDPIVAVLNAVQSGARSLSSHEMWSLRERMFEAIAVQEDGS